MSEVMDVGEIKCSSGYGKPPWIFKGSALYQLHLVKAETARACIPKEFRLVEAFGYTLGGFFLASYDDSPAGVFDELVVIAGLAWNPPTSCARWAAKVLVNSNEACDHGRKEVGLPSQIARFSKSITAMTAQPKNKDIGILNAIGMGATFDSPRDHMNVQVTEWDDLDTKDTCNINLTTVVPALNEKWMGPGIKISLPSYSGHTEHNPNLLKYSCQIECRVRAVKPAVVSGPSPIPYHDRAHYSDQRRCNTMDSTAKEHIDNGQNLIMSVMLSKPILALEFNCLKMQFFYEFRSMWRGAGII
ncbi:protein NEOXANTHIN-DEFICIENT 1 isoform X1 [Juglans microcarpa x Juglans regia]|uniref:protein NEOXANTHIN-DEFICIENT 1 isoform X1 n=1 Tax=Juglans microcarpa x Juglans regia TaxID=2249226 RepID=UPI001B7EA86D|nr:protein NEOXANTHIN-DEFICIENT 1 isoform X1 [Juglans microcarpa x Juglans regia]XP_041011838.1 protein NEOXANTHIN-DEFICIENT 1 isoform X1 [Juglans microcarpa x Juglans regia]